ncbi:hypothetical protein MRX96_025419 [Rhipicephalus microplus]
MEVAEALQPPARLPLHSEEQDDTPFLVHGRQFQRMQRAEQRHQSTLVLHDGSVELRNENVGASRDPFIVAWESWYRYNSECATLCLLVLRYCTPLVLVAGIVLGIIFWMATHGFRYAMLMPSP